MKNTNTSKKHSLAVAITATLISTQTLAAGFQINEHSAASLGRALAGEAAIAENASALAHNPALASFFEGTHLSAGLSYIAPDVNANGTVTNNLPGTTTLSQDVSANDVAPDAYVPNSYFLHSLNDRLALGLSLNSHFGLSTDYGDDFVASDLANFAEVLTVSINPSLSYKITDNLAVGGGANILYGKGHLQTSLSNYQQAIFEGGRQQINAALPANQQLPEYTNNNVSELEGDGWAVGYNLGVAYKPVESVTVGFSYRSEVALSLEGESNTGLNQRAALNPAFNTLAVTALNNDASLDLDLPAISQLAVAWDATEQLKVSASAHLIEWSSVPSITVQLPNPTGGDFDRTLEELEWDDTWRYGIAAAYALSDAWTIRAGYAIDESPTNDAHRTLAIPDGNRNWLSFGASLKVSEKISVDAGYTFIDGKSVPVNRTNPLGTSFNGVTEGDAQVFALSVNYAL